MRFCHGKGGSNEVWHTYLSVCLSVCLPVSAFGFWGCLLLLSTLSLPMLLPEASSLSALAPWGLLLDTFELLPDC